MKKTLLLLSGLLFLLSIKAQDDKAFGFVYDTADQAVIGAIITVKDNPKIKSTTNAEGRFSLSREYLGKKIIVSYVGMKPQETDFAERKKIVLTADSKALNEVVVTGMQKIDKRLFTGATTKIEADKALISGIADISRSLEGRVAGVSVQNVSGTFGTAPKIRVRGATSIYGNSKPLWVVDQVVLEDAVDVSADQLSSGDAVTLISSAIAGLNADDIESFQILKDGSATSIYGARAMSGVIVVTTKRGKSGASRINYTCELTMRTKPSYKTFNITNSQEQMGIYKEMKDKGWLEIAKLSGSSSSGVYGKMYEMLDTFDPVTQTYGLENSEESINNYLRQAEFRNTNWFDLLFKNSVVQNHAISMSTGSDKARLYASVSAMHDPGWTLASSVERYTANVNAAFNVLPTLTINLLTNGSHRSQEAPGTLSQETDVVRGEVKRNFDINPYSYALNTSRTLDRNAYYKRNYASFNIFNELNNNYISMNVNDLKFQGEAQWKPIRGLDLSALGAIRYQATAREHFIKDHSNQALAYRAGIDPEDASIRDVNPFLYTNPDDENALPETVLPKGGIYLRNDYSIFQADFRTTASYNLGFGSKEQHLLNIFGGIESNLTDRNSVFFQGWGYQYDNGGVPFVDYRLFKQQKEENGTYYGDTWTYSRSLAAFATTTLSFNNKYVLNLTGRYEGTNKLGKSTQSRWLPTWNISGAWNMHEESFFKQIQPTVSHFTLKASYSLTADRGPSWVTNAQPVYRSYTPWRPLTNVSETGMQLEDLENSELTYEKKHELNIGTDMGFFNNDINLAIDAYTRNNYDLIGQVYTSGVGGIISKYANVASMKSHGVEFTLSTKNISSKDFKWTSDFTFSYATNEITDLKSRNNVIKLVSGTGFAREGYPVRALFSIPFNGLNEEGLPTFTNEDGKVTVSDIDFQEFKKLGFLKYEGPTDPTTTGGFGNLLTYKNFRVNIFLTYSFGNVVRLDPMFRSQYTDMMAMPKEFKNRWTKPGDEAYTNIPVIASARQYANDSQISYAYNAYNYSTARIADGGFVRLKEISVAYDIPKKILSSLKINDLQLKLQATNLWLLYADKKLNGQDPEFMNSGGVATPMPKQFTLTLKLGI